MIYLTTIQREKLSNCFFSIREAAGVAEVTLDRSHNITIERITGLVNLIDESLKLIRMVQDEQPTTYDYLQRDK